MNFANRCKYGTPGSYDAMHILDLTFVALLFCNPIYINQNGKIL